MKQTKDIDIVIAEPVTVDDNKLKFKPRLFDRSPALWSAPATQQYALNINL